MFVQPFAYAFLLAAGAAAQESSSVEGFMTIQTSGPSLGAPVSSAIASASSLVASVSSAVGSVVSEPASISSLLPTQTDGPLTNPLRPTETIPQLTFCNGVYTNTPCVSSATGVMSIPQGETPLPSSASPAPSSVGLSSAGGASTSGAADQRSTTGRIVPTSSVSGSVPSATSNVNKPGAASSLLRGDSLIWAAALSGLSVTLGFAFTLL